MLFEWDDTKAASNLKKHGVPFEYATRLFADPQRIDVDDARYEYGEGRRITVGRIEGRVFVVVYTVRDETTRLISARKANRREERNYVDR